MNTIDILPDNGIDFTLREVYLYIDKTNSNPNEFFELGTDPILNLRHPKVLCSSSNFYNKYKYYTTSGVILSLVDSEIQVGAPKTVLDINLKELNKDIDTTIGFVEKNTSLACNVHQF